MTTHTSSTMSKALRSNCLRGAALTLLLMSISSRLQMVQPMANGAPAVACVNLRPLHGFHLAKPASASQFFVSQSALGYKLGENVTVDLVTHSNERHFRGFIVQAYDPSSGAQIGQFIGNDDSRPIDSCSAATHRNRQTKKRVTITWVPKNSTSLVANGGALSHRQVRFRASIVVSYEEFYTGFESSDQSFDRFDFAAGSPARLSS